MQKSDPANAAPVFPDQDATTPGDQSDSTTRTVAENVDAGTTIGGTVHAIDDDEDLMMYTLSGADADSFTVVRNDGQLKTKAKLDYETKKVYMVTVTATDPSGATDSIAVTINVTDENDDAVISGNASYSYAENGTAAVATFTATDQDGDAIVWTLTGDTNDKEDFTITNGVLAFKSSPNFESPDDADINNVYKVTVSASGGTLDVTVTVTNVDEAGVVTLDKPQPQAGRTLTASLTDADKGVSGDKWQWSRGASVTGPWFTIQNATGQARPPTADDVNSYLRATVTYTDVFGSGKTASAVSANAVEARTVANSAPKFTDEDADTQNIEVSRDVTEGAVGSAVGKPVTATDADGDVLIYTLAGTDGTGDAARFEIDSASGQIKTTAKLDFEAAAASAANCATKNDCSVTVTATDPSGAFTSQVVTIDIEDANEAPAFTSGTPAGANAVKEIWLKENATDGALFVNSEGTTALNTTAYAADDEDQDLDSRVVLDLEGADKDFFVLSQTGGLTVGTTNDVRNQADYEKKSSYSITVVVTSGGTGETVTAARKMTFRQDVTVNVIDQEDGGTITLSQREPQLDGVVVATLTDPDGGVSVSTWKWYRSDADADADPRECDADVATTVIGGASSSTYTPKSGDEHRCLKAEAVYTDNIAPTTSVTLAKVSERRVQLADPANTAPVFPDQDPTTPGDQSDSATRTVAENTPADENIGSPFDATDTDLVIHTLSGADADSFAVARNDGQLKTKAALDYETKKVYMVTVTATDPSGATDSIAVTINVTDVDDGATIIPGGGGGTNNAPTFGASSASRSVAENTAAGTAIGAPVTATDADGDALTYSVSGADSSSFTIGASTGQLMTSAALDYETKSSYTVTVAASDGTASATISVTINVTDADEAGFDLNGNGTIERNEVISAIGSYIGGTGGVQRSAVIGLIGRYISGS